ncbi:hypothetical protein LXL04_017272 [Taraxacum kok-saghyz]
MVTVFRLLDFLIPIAKPRLQDCPLHSRFCQQISFTLNFLTLFSLDGSNFHPVFLECIVRNYFMALPTPAEHDSRETYIQILGEFTHKTTSTTINRVRTRSKFRYAYLLYQVISFTLLLTHNSLSAIVANLRFFLPVGLLLHIS